MRILWTGICLVGVFCSISGQAIFAEGGSTFGVFSTSSNSIGVYGISTSGTGVFGQSTGHWGVYGFSGSSVGVVGYGQTYDFDAQGPGINYGTTSSIRWKTNVQRITDPLDKLRKLRGVYFDWDEEHGAGHDIGFIAEEVGEVIPEIVAYEENGIDAKGMDYSKISPLLVEAIKAIHSEFQSKFDEQEQQIHALQQQLTLLRQQLYQSEIIR